MRCESVCNWNLVAHLEVNEEVEQAVDEAPVSRIVVCIECVPAAESHSHNHGD